MTDQKVSKIEAVARAICSALKSNPDEIIEKGDPPDGADLPSDPDADEHSYVEDGDHLVAWKLWRFYAAAAIAAIEATRAFADD